MRRESPRSLWRLRPTRASRVWVPESRWRPPCSTFRMWRGSRSPPESSFASESTYSVMALRDCGVLFETDPARAAQARATSKGVSIRSVFATGLVALLIGTPISAQTSASPHSRWSAGAVGYAGVGVLLGAEIARRVAYRGPVRVVAEFGALGDVGVTANVACLNSSACRNTIPRRASAIAMLSLTGTVGGMPRAAPWYALGSMGIAGVRWEQATARADGRALQLAAGIGRAVGAARIELRVVRLADGSGHVDGGRLSYSRVW